MLSICVKVRVYEKIKEFSNQWVPLFLETKGQLTSLVFFLIGSGLKYKIFKYLAYLDYCRHCRLLQNNVIMWLKKQLTDCFPEASNGIRCLLVSINAYCEIV